MYIYLIKSAAHLGAFLLRAASRCRETSRLRSSRPKQDVARCTHSLLDCHIHIKQTMLILSRLPWTAMLNTEKNARTDARCCEQKHAAHTGSAESVCNCESARCDVTRATVERSSVHSCSYGLLSTVHSLPDSGEKTK